MTQRLRNFCFTSFAEEAPVFDDTKMKYLTYGREVCPTTGKKHLQGYCELLSQMTVGAIQKKIFAGEKLHLESRKGSAHDAASYCWKDGNYMQFGDLSTQGARNDLQSVIDGVNSGWGVIDVVNNTPHQFIKFHKGIKELMFWKSKARAQNWRDVNVMVLWGASGVGKTRSALQHGGFKLRAGDSWYDGYDGEDTLILDEFTHNCIEWSELLSLLDGHPLRMPIKGSHVYAMWTTVILTSNLDPKLWYKGVIGDMSPLFRRIKSIVELTPQTATSFSDVVGNTNDHLESGEELSTEDENAVAFYARSVGICDFPREAKAE